MNAKKRHKIKLGIRNQLIIGFMLFTLLFGILLWVFQTTFLNSFYVIIKEQELKAVANHITEYLDSDELYDQVITQVRDANVDILITDEVGMTQLKVSQMGSNFLMRFNFENCRKIYTDTVNEGGEQFINFVRSEDNIDINPSIDFILGNDDRHFGFIAPTDRVDQDCMIYSKIVNVGQSDSLMIILVTAMVPVNSTIDTLQYLLLWVTGLMIVLSLVLAIFLSRTLSKPIVSINENAAKLASGEYDTHFEDSNIKEISELANTLNYTGKELAKVDQFRKELIANVSHDLRTPLTMITGYGEVMRDIPGENTPENMQIIIDEANRLSLLVNDLLDISKLETGQITLSKEKYDLTENIKEILGRYDKLTDYKISFEYDTDAYVFADRLKLTQVIYNLINNAITYTGDDKCIYITQEVSDNEVKVSITDTGEGIPPDKLPYIWDRYYKIDKSHKRASVGTGLGLSIVKNILTLHGAKFGVISNENEGSTFWFTINLSSDIL